MGNLKGAPELKARLSAIKTTFKPAGRKWAQRTVELVKPTVPERTGKGRRSVRVKNASMKRATVSAVYYVAILDKGAKAHAIRPKRARTLAFDVGGRTVFAKAVHKPEQRGMGFAQRAANRAIRDEPLAAELVRQWNGAA
jgi:hypothetical protein